MFVILFCFNYDKLLSILSVGVFWNVALGLYLVKCETKYLARGNFFVLSLEIGSGRAEVMRNRLISSISVLLMDYCRMDC